ncbi:MAG: CpsB/CapC family capsule biosynthesis tyrosine phosphatase [Candidatus Celaenobacter polaris]|nr:CpsB/CapC family capsule biosynthesis tyrosine phosphatase [Candidatus Celaenobacter polaris]
MIDIHTHVLPGIDDGAQDIFESLEILQALANQGVTELVATPHIISGVYENTRSIIDRKLIEVQDFIEERELSMKIYPGAELYCEPDVISKVKRENLTLAQSNYILIETELQRFPDNFEEILFNFQQEGFRPIIAHAERFSPFMNNIDYLLTIVNREIYIQMNCGSILGVYGNAVRDLALKMLNIGCVHLIASDVHGLKKRPILLKDAYDFVASHHSEDIAEILFYENPKRIISNEPLINNFEGYYDERKKKSFLRKLRTIFRF